MLPNLRLASHQAAGDLLASGADFACNLHFRRIMADRHDELPVTDVVVDAVDHAPAAKGQAHTFVVPRAAGDRVA